MDLNIRLLILDKDEAHAEELARKFMAVLPFFQHEVVSDIQSALEAHLENPFNVSLITSSIQDEDKDVFVSDMQKLYMQSKDRICAFIAIFPAVAPNIDLHPYKQKGYSTVISEEFNERDKKNLDKAIGEFTHFKKINDHIAELEDTMKMILTEVDRVSSDRKRGRNSKFNKIAIKFATDLAEFDTKVMDKYFDCLTEQSSNKKAKKSKNVKIPETVLSKNLPNLEQNRYSGASSRVWEKLLDKFGTDKKED